MKAKHFIAKLDEKQIIAAIAAAEQHSSGQIRVYIAHRKRPDALTAAQERFIKLGMDKTRQRNAVLLYLAPESHQFSIVGDVGVHEKCGDSFWQEIVQEMAPLLKSEKYTNAMIGAIQRVGGVLARHFPRDPDHPNELPDSIAHD